MYQRTARETGEVRLDILLCLSSRKLRGPEPYAPRSLSLSLCFRHSRTKLMSHSKQLTLDLTNQPPVDETAYSHSQNTRTHKDTHTCACTHTHAHRHKHTHARAHAHTHTQTTWVSVPLLMFFHSSRDSLCLTEWQPTVDGRLS